MPGRQIIIRDTLWSRTDGFEFSVRPTTDAPIRLMDLAHVRVAIDGEWMDADQLSIALGKDEFRVSDLARATATVWEAPRSAAVVVHGVARPVPGTDHHLAVELAYRASGEDSVQTDRYVTIETAA